LATGLVNGLREDLMEGRIRVIQQGGKSVIFADLSECHADEATRLFVEERRWVSDAGGNSVLVLTDVRGTRFDEKTVEAVKETLKVNSPYVRASAVIGVSGLQKIVSAGLLAATGPRFKLFEDKEEALTWLVEQ
jgi:hypothetical protein